MHVEAKCELAYQNQSPVSPAARNPFFSLIFIKVVTINLVCRVGHSGEMGIALGS